MCACSVSPSQVRKTCGADGQAAVSQWDIARSLGRSGMTGQKNEPGPADRARDVLGGPDVAGAPDELGGPDVAGAPDELGGPDALGAKDELR
jgi:hypothetical protein